VLFAGTFVNRFGSFIFVFLTLYLIEQGYSTTEAGLGLTGYGLGGLGAALAGGLLADRIGRRNAIVLSMTGSGAAMLALWQADSLEAILPLVIAAGFFAELYRPASGALIADLVPAGRRVPAYAAYRLAINAGFAAGPAVGGLLAEDSFAWLFIGDAASSLAFAAIALVALPTGPRSARAQEPRSRPSAYSCRSTVWPSSVSSCPSRQSPTDCRSARCWPGRSY
jgi:MFS family permease